MNNTKKKKRSKNEIIFILCFTVIPVINWLVFYVGINFTSILMAFQDSEGKLSLVNFARIINEFNFEGSQLPLAFRNTLLTFAIGISALPFQVLVSYFIYKKVPFFNFYRIVFFLPSIIFGVAVAAVVGRLLSVEGFIAEWVQRLFDLPEIPELLADSRFALYTLWTKSLWLGFPGNLIIWGGMFARIPEDVLESAKIDGVNWWQEFTRIIVPMTWPTIGLQLVLSFCGVFNADPGTFLQTRGNYKTMTLACWQYLQLQTNAGPNYESNVFNYMSAVGLVMTVIAITISLSVRKFTDKVFNDIEY